jgi:hypothetical protein
MKKEYSPEEYEAYLEKLLNKFKQDPQYELKQEFGQLLMRHIDSFSPEERKRYEELKDILKEP